MKKLFALLVLALGLVACSNPVVTSSEYEYKYTDKSGAEQIVYVDVTLEDGKITEISIDETYTKDGVTTTKKELGDDYGMSSIGKVEWDDQIAHLEETLKGTDGTIALDESGYPTDADVTSGCTINLFTIQEAIKEAVAAAK